MALTAKIEFKNIKKSTLLVLAACCYLLRTTPGISKDAANKTSWQKLLQSKTSITENKNLKLTKMEAKYFTSKLKADYQPALEIGLQLLEAECHMPGSPVYLRRCHKIAKATRQLPKLRQRLSLLVQQNNLDPNLKNLLQQELLTLALKQRDLNAIRKISTNSGWINIWAKIVGPFQHFEPLQIDRKEAFASQPEQNNYTDALGKVSILHNVKSDWQGKLYLSKIVPDIIGGSVYLTALLKSSKAQQIVLSLQHSGNVRLWLNSLPIYRSDQYQGYTRPRHLHKITSKQGLNWLVVKAPANAWLRLQILNLQGGISQTVRVLKWKNRLKQKPLRYLYGVIASNVVPEFELATYPNQPSASTHPALIIRQAESLVYAGKIQQAGKLWNFLLQQYPSSTLLKIESANFKFREAKSGIDNPQRLQKEAAQFLREALKLSPQSPQAHYLLASYLKEHNAEDQALKHYQQALQAAPKWGVALVKLAGLESKRKWHELAEKNLQTALPFAPDAGFKLARLYESRTRYQEAWELDDLAWQQGLISYRRYLPLLLKRGAFKEFEKELKQYSKLYPQNKKQLLEWHIAQARAEGKIKTAYKLAQKFNARWPYNSSPYSNPGELALRLGKKQQAISILSNTLKKNLITGNPDLALRQRLRNLKKIAWIGSSYNLDLSSINTEKYSAKKYKTANYANLLQTKICRIYPDRSAEIIIHRAVKVFSKNGIAQLAELQLPDNNYDLLLCRTILPDGQIFTPVNIAELDFTRAASMYKVSVGCILEYAYRKTVKGGLCQSFATNFWFQNFNVPTAKAEITLILPQELEQQLSVKTWPRSLPAQVSKQGKDLVLTWELSDPEIIQPERGMPQRNEVLSNIALEVRGLWYSYRKGFFALGKAPRSNNKIREKAKELTRGLTTRQEKVKAIYNYVSKTLKPVSGSITARDAFISQSGDNQAVGRLVKAMLGCLGINSCFALANPAWQRHYPEARRRAQQINSFGTQLLWVDLDEKEQWLRFLSKSADALNHYCFRNLGKGISGSLALLQDNDGFLTIRQVRGQSQEHTLNRYNLKINLKDSGTAEVEGTVIFYGSAAGRVRSIAELPQEGRRRIERYATRMYPKLMLTSSTYPQSGQQQDRSEAEPFKYQFKGEIKKFSRLEAGHLSFAPFPYPLLIFKQLLTNKERKMDFLIPQDYINTIELHYLAPKGWGYTALPKSAYWQSEFGIYGMSFVVNGRQLKVSRFLIIPTRKIPAKQYPALANFITECEKTEKTSISILNLTVLNSNSDFSSTRENRIGKIIDQRKFYPYWRVNKINDKIAKNR